MAKVGVLALQGDFAEHLAMLRRLDVEGIEVRSPRELDAVESLIIPGGESTTIGKLMASGLAETLKAKAAQGLPIWGTCAGMIILARELTEGTPEPLGLIDLKVRRNAFGRQVDSFETDLSIPVLGDLPFHAVFIRAPYIEEAGSRVKVLARLANGIPVAARQGSVLVTSFHPELTSDMRFHAYFIKSVKGSGVNHDTPPATN